jgi:hypothetical protein
LLDHLRAALGVGPHDFEQSPALLILLFHLKHLRAHRDRREDIVQIVRDAAGERPDAFQPLGAQELRFESLLLGDVGVDRQDGFRLALHISH